MSADTKTMLIGSIVIALIWPLVYPGLDFVLALIGLRESLIGGLIDLGALYGKHSSTAPGFFKGLAEGAEYVSGEDPSLSHLPYMTKALLLASVSYPIVAAEIVVFTVVGALAFASRAFPGKRLKSLAQGVAVAFALVPMLVISVWCLAFFVVAYIHAWSRGMLDFAFLVLISPAVALRVTSASIGELMLARYFVPCGLSFAKDGLALRVWAALEGE